jgi:hypothetical protein
MPFALRLHLHVQNNSVVMVLVVGASIWGRVLHYCEIGGCFWYDSVRLTVQVCTGAG